VRRFKWWQVVITIVVGPFGVGMLLSAIISLVVAMIRMPVDWEALGRDPEALARFQLDLVAQTQSLPIVATSLVLTAIGFAGGPMVAARLRGVDVLDTLGLRRLPHPIALAAAPIGILALGPLSDVVVEFARRIAPNATFGALDTIDAIARSAPIYVLIPFLAFCPGFGEEILFRGFIQRAIGRGWLAISVSATTFALIHLDPHHVVGVVPLGFFLAWVAARTDSTWVSIAAHVANNSMAVYAISRTTDRAEEHAGAIDVAIGLAVCAACIFVIDRYTPRPVEEAAAQPLAESPPPDDHTG
jgi:membrane protease YdiL (CAAX protease family)